ncbi:MAG TPA: tRNA pseudouridine(55) synthase TruB [Verrucomicrobiae bacterium]|nr:tRNA pseudouridine(55) synthase TruB [Verrucomicrobiae bacterium]
MQGLLLVDKPKGWTSFDVVNFVRRRVAVAEGRKPRNVKVGHTGTLDPLATGLLVLLVGKEYTRRAPELTKLDKTYEVTMKLGEVSTTGDEEGTKTLVSDRHPGSEEIEVVLQTFTGRVMQTPPAFSAMKVGGQRAYKLAREGKAVDLEARPVQIYGNTLASYEYPLVRFTSEVGSGTYIRSLVEDLGKALDVGAYMADLRRIRVGDFNLQAAASIDDNNLLGYIAKIDSFEVARK